ncbi:Receptor-like protein kinase FERONIA [Acorus gramineus]|uniref:non-specific serine/threonine protein kinase n=1 Tax=Acorus gramineus TaxID=55184 RepID=A0AAV9B5U0_ACOGR|nr:Receptor-like protein kinase FERONIA [Acorus gramineus]
MNTQKSNRHWFSLLLVIVAVTTTIDPFIAQNTTTYVPAENILLNCGAPSGKLYALDGRAWGGDIRSSYAPAIKNTVSAIPSNQNSSIPTVPYMTTRIFKTQFTYTFPVTPGRKFIRLYFYPSNYTNLNFTASNSSFTVSVGSYTLLRNFSALLTTQAMNRDYMTKEFSVNVSSNTLNLTFTPSSAKENAFAFVNGIEIVSTPQIFNGSDIFSQPLIVGTTSTLTIDEHTALETVVRLNVGGQSVSPVDDSRLYREWDDDSPYIYGAVVGMTYPKDPNVTIKYSDTIPEYIAPPVVYGTARSMGPNASVNLNYNLTWIATVDAGFSYLVRLHFCEIINPVTKVNMRVFDVFINNQTAIQGLDVITYTNGGGIGAPIYLDFIVFFPNTSASSQQDLWVALHPDISSKPVYYDAELNGLEIFKLNDSTGNLYAQKLSAYALRHWRRRQKLILQSSVSSNQGRVFSISEIKTATKYFSESLVIGVGGFGKVYRGEINGGLTCVAIKRGNRLSNQGAHEFRTEIEVLSKLRHRHLVSLVGYCDEKDEMILVYDFMANGTLRDHLYKTQNPPLTWKQRLEICIGAARGFHYLHTGAKPGIIHRDVKTTNILLDDKWVAKVSDFGLSKVTPELDCTHVSTTVKGSFGYLDPEYFWNQKLTEKSDVYSFGVVLFEVLCGRPAMDRSLPEEQVSLSNWAMHCKRNNTIDQIIDPNLKDDVSPDSLEKFVEIAEKCLANQGTERPSMGDVLWNLEVALQMLSNAEKGESSFDPISTSSREGMMSSIDTSEDSVFSDLRSPRG